MGMIAGQILVLVTVPDLGTGEVIARSLLEKRLAACVNISPDWVSLYRWEGEVQQDQEVLLLIKTRQDLLKGQLIPSIQELHPYQVPEIIALDLVDGEQNYLDWMLQETRG